MRQRDVPDAGVRRPESPHEPRPAETRFTHSNDCPPRTSERGAVDLLRVVEMHLARVIRQQSRLQHRVRREAADVRLGNTNLAEGGGEPQLRR